MSVQSKQSEERLLEGEQSVLLEGEPLGSKPEVVQARTVIIAAKAAYHYKSPRWLKLFTNAMAAIERCPQEVRACLKSELTVFLPHWSRRPQLS